MRIIIVGVAAGMSAATRLRRLSEKDEIIVFEKALSFLLQIVGYLTTLAKRLNIAPN